MVLRSGAWIGAAWPGEAGVVEKPLRSEKESKAFVFIKVKSYKTDKKVDCWVLDSNCIHRKCFQPHDCGHRGGNGQWVESYHCAMNWNKGCPRERS